MLKYSVLTFLVAGSGTFPLSSNVRSGHDSGHNVGLFSV
jgi:hypothetical protein